MYEHQNLKNMATVMRKLVEFEVYDEQILDLLVHISYHHDQHFETHYEEDNLMRNTESSILPVTLAYHIQKQLAAFLQARDVEFKFKATKLLIPILCRTSNQLSFKHLHKIILDQFVQCDEEKKFYIFEQLKKYAIENITTQISPYAPFIFYHTLLVMMKQMPFEQIKEHLIELSGMAFKEQIGAISVKVHCILVLYHFLTQEIEDYMGVLKALFLLVEQHIQSFLPGIEKFDIDRRVYTVHDYKLTAQSEHETFD